MNRWALSLIACSLLVNTTTALADFTPHPSGVGIVDDFDSSTPDTNTWTTGLASSGILTATHDQEKIKFNATAGFN